MTPPRPSFLHPAAHPRAFTLIELLVVIAIIGVLTGITLPAIRRARTSATSLREVTAGQSLLQGYSLYANDHQSRLLPGYPSERMVLPTPPATGEPQLTVIDDLGAPVYGVPAQRYPWRLLPYLGYDFRGLYKDESTLKRYRERTDFQYVVSLSPSFGLNSMFLGGDAGAGRYGFDAQFQSLFGSFYLTRIDQAQRPSDLLAFASAHGVNPDGGELVPGYFRIDSPFRVSRSWWPSLDFSLPPGSTGGVHFRHESKAATVMLDGHATKLDFVQLNDMRRWSDKASKPDWTLGTR